MVSLTMFVVIVAVGGLERVTVAVALEEQTPLDVVTV
jgi:hypothetical protein